MTENTTARPLDEAFVTTSDIDLATALATLGVPFYPKCPALRMKNAKGDDYTNFNFMSASPDGRYEAAHLCRCWNDSAFAAANNEHPLIFLKFGLMNRKRIIDAAKSNAPLIPVKRFRGGKEYTYLVREGGDAHKELVEEIKREAE